MEHIKKRAKRREEKKGPQMHGIINFSSIELTVRMTHFNKLHAISRTGQLTAMAAGSASVVFVSIQFASMECGVCSLSLHCMLCPPKSLSKDCSRNDSGHVKTIHRVNKYIISPFKR